LNRLLGLTLARPTVLDETRQQAEKALAELRQSFSTKEVEAALAHGAGMELESVVQEILGTWLKANP
jgi:hypothetical protein